MLQMIKDKADHLFSTEHYDYAFVKYELLQLNNYERDQCQFMCAKIMTKLSNYQKAYQITEKLIAKDSSN